MSGTIGDNVYRASGVVAAASAGGGISWQDVVTASTLTAEAGNGYPIDTTSNTCAITLPASTSVGDEIIFTDYAGTWETNIISLDPNGLNYQSKDDTHTIEYNTNDQVLHIVYIDATQGWMPVLDKAVTPDVGVRPNDYGIFGFGFIAPGDTNVGMTNLVSNVGVMAADVAAVGTARFSGAATEYGGDKGIFGFGTQTTGWTYTAITNLVSNAGVVASDQAATTGTARDGLAACEYGYNKGIFGYGVSAASMTNLVSGNGVVSTDVTGVGTGRNTLSACEYGNDKGIFGYGHVAPSRVAITNLVSNTGVVAADQAATTGTARSNLAGCSYSTDKDKGIFGFGYAPPGVGMTNLVSNTGVVAADVAAVAGATVGYHITGCEYGQDKGIFAFRIGYLAISNLISNAGVVASDTAAVAGVTGRHEACGCSFG